jgi:hypothetical protein
MTDDADEDSLTDQATDRPAYCSVCGAELPDPGFALNYPNFVCDECNSRAVNADGENPWHGWPPGEQPETEQGVIPMAPDRGENPVYIDGIKCWRRYRFGGHIAFRDTFDCDSLEEFYATHETDDSFLQVYNSPDPPGDCTHTDRLLIEKVDDDDFTAHIWGMLSAETGDILARNAIAENTFGPFESFLDHLKDRVGGEEYYEQTLTDPTRMLSFFYSFGSQAHKPRALYLVPELDRPLSGLSAIVETGALRGLRSHDVSDTVSELGIRPASQCAALYDATIKSDKSSSQTQMTLEAADEVEDSPEPEGSTLTVRYDLPHRHGLNAVRKLGAQIAQSVLQEVVIATQNTDYTYLSSLPAVDIHAYRGQQEIMTVAVDAETVEQTEWENLSDSPTQVADLAVTYSDQLN